MIEPVLSDDAFMADVESAPESPSLLHLWWLGQSGYLVQWNGCRLLIDPYLSDSLTAKYANTDKPHVRMTRRVVDPVRLRRINFITSSHAHSDHLDPQTLPALRDCEFHPIFIAPRAVREIAETRWGGDIDYGANEYEPLEFGDVRIDPVAAAHDTIERDVHGNAKCLGYVFTLGSFRVYHSGDTVVYDGLVERLKPFNLDLAILPINGKVGNMSGCDAARLAHDIGAKLAIPCHYEMFEFNTADPRDEFIPECERLGQPYKVLRAGERLTLDAAQFRRD